MITIFLLLYNIFVNIVIVKQLVEYIWGHFGLHATIQPASENEIGRLPLYLKGSFRFFTGNIEGRPVLWAEVVEEAEVTPDRLEKQGRSLKNLFFMPVVFVFGHLDAWQRKRFVEKKIAFIQPSKQLYIPEMLMDLSDVFSDNKESLDKKEFLSYPAQCAILYHLQKESVEGKAFQIIAKMLHYSAMTITRIAKELTIFNLAEVEDGKEKFLSFDQKGKDLWNRALPFLSTPVKEIWFFDEHVSNNHFLQSGGFALDEYSMLSPPDRMSYAIGKEEFRSLKAIGGLPRLDKRYGDFKIEVWHYNPILLSEPDAKVVDRLSLYLSLQQQNDERVLTALNEMINTIRW